MYLAKVKKNDALLTEALRSAFNEIYDDIHAEVREFWDQLERALKRSADAYEMTDLLGEYRHRRQLGPLIDNEADKNPAHHAMLENALAIAAMIDKPGAPEH